MFRLPTIIQGHQKVVGKLRPQEARKVLERAVEQLKTHPDPKVRRREHLQSVAQGVQREQFHTGGRYPASGKSLFGEAYEAWSDDMACILQGTCLPGSTKYCRTKSMFGKLDIRDIMQGVPGSGSRTMSTFCRTLPSNSRFIHTVPASGFKLPQPAENKVCIDTQGSVDGIRVESGLPQQDLNGETTPVLQVTCLPGNRSMFGTLQLLDMMQGIPQRSYSTQPPSSHPDTTTSTAATETQLTQRERLKRAMKDYGSTVIVFHVCISLMSLGGFYVAVSSGLDVPSLLTAIGVSADVVASRIATGTSTFLMAYGVHKVFAPVRIAITLTCTPLIVRYLRRVGFLKVKTSPVPK